MSSFHDRFLTLLLWGFLTLLVAFGASSRLMDITSTPDFTKMKSIQAKKDAFFTYLLPKVLLVNSEILRERQSLPCLTAEEIASSFDSVHLRQLAIKYRVPDRDALSDSELCEALIARISVIPVALVLAQAANESAWGTSRFARQQNNYFGLWCFTAECGVRPEAADSNTRHRVAAFDDVIDGLRYYALTLNSHPAYVRFRSLRRALEVEGKPIRASMLLSGLDRYSERGEAYLEELRQMIRVNRLNSEQRIHELLALATRQ